MGDRPVGGRGRQSPLMETWEAEEHQLLEAVAQELLVRRQPARSGAVEHES
jgi:hypothetical protein